MFLFFLLHQKINKVSLCQQLQCSSLLFSCLIMSSSKPINNTYQVNYRISCFAMVSRIWIFFFNGSNLCNQLFHAAGRYVFPNVAPFQGKLNSGNRFVAKKQYNKDNIDQTTFSTFCAMFTFTSLYTCIYLVIIGGCWRDSSKWAACTEVQGRLLMH